MGLTKKQTIFIISGFISVVAIAIVVAGLATNWFVSTTTSTTTTMSTGSSFNNPSQINPISNASTGSQTSLDEATTGTTVQKPQTISYYNFPSTFESFQIIISFFSNTDDGLKLIDSYTLDVKKMDKKPKNLADYTTYINANDAVSTSTGTGQSTTFDEVSDKLKKDVDTTQLSGNMDPDETFLTGYDGEMTGTTDKSKSIAFVFTEIDIRVKLYLLALSDDEKYTVLGYSDATQIQDNTNILSNFADKTLNNTQDMLDLFNSQGITPEYKIQL